MADAAVRLQDVPEGVRVALGLTLLVVFGIKAAIFPLFSWLPDSYPTAPVAGDRRLRRPAHQGRRLRDPAHADAAVPRLARRSSRVLLVLAVADDGRRHPRRDRAGRPQAAAVVHDRQPHRLHAARARASASTAGPGRRGPLHRPPHRRADDAVPRRRAGRAARGHRLAAPRAAGCSTSRRCSPCSTCCRRCRWPASRRCRASSPSSACCRPGSPTAARSPSPRSSRRS